MSHPEGYSGTEAELRAYFRDLDTALSRLPRAERKQLTSEIRQHIDTAIAEHPPASAAELRNLLDRFGRPEDIAAARDEEPEQQHRPALKGQPMLIASVAIGVVMLAGLGTGLALAFSSPNSPRKPPVAGSHATAGHATSPAAAATSPAAPATSPARSPASSAGPTASPGSLASSPGSPTASPASTAFAVLSPATVPPVSSECTEQLVYGADGNVSPLTCPGGGVNTAAWHALAASGLNGAAPTVLTLGRYADPGQVYQAMCHDISTLHYTKPMAISVEELGQAYYGWNFGVSPVEDIESVGCPTP